MFCKSHLGFLCFRNMHAMSINQIADILHFNDNTLKNLLDTTFQSHEISFILKLFEYQ